VLPFSVARDFSHPRTAVLCGISLRKYRIIEVADWRVNFSSDAPANFAGLLAVSQGICRMQLAEKALPSVAAVLCGISLTIPPLKYRKIQRAGRFICPSHL
jgi:hypothetical protein